MRNFTVVRLPNLAYSPEPEKAPRKQPVRGYFEGRKKHVEVPDHVVAGIKWLHEQGFPPRMIVKFYPGMTKSYFYQVTQGICRLTVKPAPPVFMDGEGWRSRYRWPSTTVED